MKKSLMIVDDEETILYAVKRLFTPEGYEVVTAIGGQQCIEELVKGFKGVMLIDILMPKMDGWDTIKEIVNKKLLNGNPLTGIMPATSLVEQVIQVDFSMIDFPLRISILFIL